MELEIVNDPVLATNFNKMAQLYKVIEFNFDGYKYYIPNFQDFILYFNYFNLNNLIEQFRKLINNKLIMFCEKINSPNNLDKYICEFLVKQNKLEIINFYGTFKNDISDYFLSQRDKVFTVLKTKLYMKGLLE